MAALQSARYTSHIVKETPPSVNVGRNLFHANPTCLNHTQHNALSGFGACFIRE